MSGWFLNDLVLPELPVKVARIRLSAGLHIITEGSAPSLYAASIASSSFVSVNASVAFAPASTLVELSMSWSAEAISRAVVASPVTAAFEAPTIAYSASLSFNVSNGL